MTYKIRTYHCDSSDFAQLTDFLAKNTILHHKICTCIFGINELYVTDK